MLLNNPSSVFSTEHGYLAVVLQWSCTAVFREAIHVSLGQEQRAIGCPRSSEQDWVLSLVLFQIMGYEKHNLEIT